MDENENTAWKQFEKTGKIKDYIDYTNMKNTVAVHCQVTGQAVCSRELNADKNRGISY